MSTPTHQLARAIGLKTVVFAPAAAISYHAYHASPGLRRFWATSGLQQFAKFVDSCDRVVRSITVKKRCLIASGGVIV